MLRLFKKPTPPLPTHSNASSLLDRMISLWLAYAKAENASAIVIGMPRLIPPSVAGQNELAFKQQLLEGRDPPVPTPDCEANQALILGSRLRSVAGWRSVPIWMEHAGQLYPYHGPPIDLYLALLSLIQQRLVSLDASADSPKGTHVIEYDSDEATHRCFAEVELLLLEDNTLRIEVLRHLRRPASVRAAGSTY